MARAPLQILVFPYRFAAGGALQFALFRRSDGDGDVWQAVSGGAEDDETPEAAARREMNEEAAIPADAELIALDARASVPAHGFAASALWGPEVYVVPEYAFGVALAADAQVILSPEHTEHRWLSYDDARALLTWDSNKVALWELNTRLGRARA
jgi:dATP pyrophosphohydrolase